MNSNETDDQSLPGLRFLLPWFLITALFSTLAGASLQQISAVEPGLHQLSEKAWAWVAPDDRTSNGALFVGKNSALLVDPGLTPELARQFLEAAASVTDRPIRHAVLTHWHPDHSLGSLCLGRRPYTLIAHPWTRRRFAETGVKQMASVPPLKIEEKRTIDSCRPVLPEMILSDETSFDLGEHRIEIFHTGPAHTSGDLVVWSPQERVLATGDLFLTNSLPYMGQGSIFGWIEALDRLITLDPHQVVPGHFEPTDKAQLAFFRDYLSALLKEVRSKVDAGVSPSQIGAEIKLSRFETMRQFPQYGATFSGNAETVARQILSEAARLGEMGGFSIAAGLDVGLNPHQIAFSADGETAYIAAAGSDQITKVAVSSLQVLGNLSVEGVPLGVTVLSGDRLSVAHFGQDRISFFKRNTVSSQGAAGKSLVTGKAPSLFAGPLPGGRYLLSVEQADEMLVIDSDKEEIAARYSTGSRPFPPGFTSDGRLAFVPNYNDGTVTIIDLWNQKVKPAVAVGIRPSGGAVLPGDGEYAVAVRGENKIAFINTATHQVTGELKEGIGQSPFSVVVVPNGKLAFVNNTASHDISVIDLEQRRVVARIPVPDQPIVMAVHPSGATLWVASEGVDRLTVIKIPQTWVEKRDAPAGGAQSPTQVGVLGMIHDAHRTSALWGLDQIRETIRRFAPDVVCAEIPPDRWPQIWSDFAERGLLRDNRIRVFPEYTDVLLPLRLELGFEIVPCAAWTQEMSDLRQNRIRQIETDEALASKREEYRRQTAAARERRVLSEEQMQDPRIIHSPAYDEQTRSELSIYDAFLNDWIGPGGWTHINHSHQKLIDDAIRKHSGRRILITFGAGHKYWFLEQLQKREDIELVDMSPYLP